MGVCRINACRERKRKPRPLPPPSPERELGCDREASINKIVVSP